MPRATRDQRHTPPGRLPAVRVPAPPLFLLLPLLVVTIAGVCGLVFLADGELSRMDTLSQDSLDALQATALAHGTAALRARGEEYTRLRAESIAAQIATYIAMHSRATIRDLRADPRFAEC